MNFTSFLRRSFIIIFFYSNVVNLYFLTLKRTEVDVVKFLGKELCSCLPSYFYYWRAPAEAFPFYLAFWILLSIFPKNITSNWKSLFLCYIAYFVSFGIGYTLFWTLFISFYRWIYWSLKEFQSTKCLQKPLPSWKLYDFLIGISSLLILFY